MHEKSNKAGGRSKRRPRGDRKPDSIERAVRAVFICMVATNAAVSRSRWNERLDAQNDTYTHN